MRRSCLLFVACLWLACSADPSGSVCETQGDCADDAVCQDQRCVVLSAVCVPGETEECGAVGSEGEFLDVGECRVGLRVCNPRAQWEACAGSVEPEPEACNGLDDDCDGATDESVMTVCYVDEDGDGVAPEGAAGTARCGVCDDGFTETEPLIGSIDCDDSDPSRYNGAFELCDRLDTDCSSETPEESGEDMDNDGHAPMDAACERGFPKDDCYDENPAASPEQAMFFESDRGDGSFDFNCDGQSEREFPTRPRCSTIVEGCRVLNEGFLTPIPDCGMPGSRQSGCFDFMSVCAPGFVADIQRCR